VPMVEQSGEVNQYYGGGDGCAKDKINHKTKIFKNLSKINFSSRIGGKR
jgi:hypothetical protein